MKTVVLAVLLSGTAGAFLYRLAVDRVAEALSGTDQTGTLEDGTENSSSGGLEESCAPARRKARKRMLLVVCSVLCGGAMAAFLEFYYHDTPLNIVNTLLFYSVLCPCAWADLRARLIPNPVLIFGLLLRCGVLGAELLLLPKDILMDLIYSATASLAICLVGVLCRLAAPKSIGFGDIKLLMLAGFFLGTDRAWNCIFFAILASFACSLLLLLTKRATLKTELPYAPFLLFGVVSATFLVNI